VGFIWGLSYLTKLEKDRDAYDNYPDEPRSRDTTLDEEYEEYNSKCVYSTDLLSKLEVISKEDNVKLRT
jgi:hypothetical protein